MALPSTARLDHSVTNDNLTAADASADASRRNADLLSALSELVDHVDDLSNAGSANRMAEGDTASPLVHLLAVQP